MPTILFRKENKYSDVILMASSAKVCGLAKQYGPYARLGVLRVKKGSCPRQISDRNKDVLEVIESTGGLFRGSTSECQYYQKLIKIKSRYRMKDHS